MFQILWKELVKLVHGDHTPPCNSCLVILFWAVLECHPVAHGVCTKLDWMTSSIGSSVRQGKARPPWEV